MRCTPAGFHRSVTSADQWFYTACSYSSSRPPRSRRRSVGWEPRLPTGLAGRRGRSSRDRCGCRPLPAGPPGVGSWAGQGCGTARRGRGAHRRLSEREKSRATQEREQEIRARRQSRRSVEPHGDAHPEEDGRARPEMPRGIHRPRTRLLFSHSMQVFGPNTSRSGRLDGEFSSHLPRVGSSTSPTFTSPATTTNPSRRHDNRHRRNRAGSRTRRRPGARRTRRGRGVATPTVTDSGAGARSPGH